MGWSVGFDTRWNRDIGYGVPAYCDHPSCSEEIDRGLGYVCGGEPYGGDRGCGLYFCDRHFVYSPRYHHQLCERCYPRIKKPFSPKPDHPAWVQFKMTDPSWEGWRKKQLEKPKRVGWTRRSA